MVNLGKVTPNFDLLQKQIRMRLVKDHVSSLAVAVAQDGQLLWTQEFGWADQERNRLATKQTMYAIASVTKPLTATALMILTERGKIDLDRSINDYLGNLPLPVRVKNARPPTVRELANHTAGLPMHYQFYYTDQNVVCPTVAETISRYGQIIAPPGERFAYSNLGYAILGYIIEQVTGVSYDEFVQREVCLPLGMAHTTVTVGLEHQPWLALRYDALGQRLPWYEVDTPGASAIFASVSDLVRFGLFHLQTPLPDQKPILSAMTLDEMQSSRITFAPGRGYGLGWWTNADVYGYHTVSHAGSMDGASASLWLIPSERVVVATAANAECELPFEIVDDIFSYLLPPYAAGLAQDRLSKPAESASAASIGLPFEPPIELLGEWVGLILIAKVELPFLLYFLAGGEVQVQIGRQPKMNLHNVRLAGNRLSGQILDTIDSIDTGHLTALRLDLTLRKTVLNGAAVAITSQVSKLGETETQRSSSAISYWIELQKKR